MQTIRKAEEGNPLEINMPEFTNRMVAAHKARKTGAQCHKGLCNNTYEDGTHCIIGSGLPEGFIRAIDEENDMGIATLVNRNYISIPNKYLDRLVEIQRAHDNACTDIGKSRATELKNLRDRLRKFAITIKRDYPEAYAEVK